MPKPVKKQINSQSELPNLNETVMSAIKSGKVTMKPKWYFLLGSIISTLSLVGLSIGVVFAINLTLFLLKSHGRMTQWKLELMLAGFPWWIPVLAIFGIILGIWLMKKYDFSYQKNFALIAAFFVVAMLIAGIMIDYFGINESWSKRGPMQRFYQQLNNRNDINRPWQKQLKTPKRINSLY
jgi:hypothetical protein